MSIQCHEQCARRHPSGARFSVLAPLVVVVLAGLCACFPARAEPPRVLPAGQLPADARLGDLRDLNGYFPLEVVESASEWARRAERIRRQMLVSQGLWPMPTPTPLNPVVHGRVERDGYSVEKAYFESFPGFFVTGSLYRPLNKTGRVPGVLCPHGHWADGRFHDAGLESVKKQIEQGAEKYEEGGRSPLQARCMQLARMGCVVFHYDMIGYADSTQISFELAHRFAKQRPEMNTLENWGLFSTQAETHLQSVMGLQTYNSIRALDFLGSLPDVDPERIAVTGASGGGTQTFMVCGVDARPAVAMPAVMVSTAMQGGCTCENACCLRIGTGNVEFAALFAPKPLGLTAANDWTKEMETKGFPELKRHYELRGAPDKAMLSSHVEFGHNYNYVSRAAMYQWLNNYLQLGQPEPIVEGDYQRLTADELTVWDEQHPRPQGGPDFERSLLRRWHDDAQQQLAQLRPTSPAKLRAFRDVVGGAVDVLIGRGLPDAADVEYEQTDKVDQGDHLRMAGLLRNKPRGEELPILFYYPKQWEGQVVIWAHENGKSGIENDEGQATEAVRQLLSAGVSVVGIDLLYQGEFLDGKPLEKTRRVNNPREAAAYTFGFNPSLFASRVHDLLTVITFVRNHEYTPKQVHLIGLDAAGPWVAAARAQARDAVSRAVVDSAGFRFGQLQDIHDPRFLPGGARYLDLPGMLALSAPEQLWLAGETPERAAIVADAYRSAGGEKNLVWYDGPAAEKVTAAVKWLLQPGGQR